jgi:hypothetical protein
MKLIVRKYSVLMLLYTTIVFAAAAAAPAYGKDMAHRLGVGIKNNTSQSLPSLALVYNINSNLGMTGGFGLDTQKDYSALQLQVGVRHIIFHETNLHFYAGGQIGLVSFENPVDGKTSGFEANMVAGAEFFMTGLENLGFTFEGGVGLSSIKNTRVRTIADSPFKAGIIFYF